ncbi:YgjP-like metallopeptidase domain-containing protein [Aquipseudomonas alcaligenes]|uniref:YgjP-like metallopeptidase domain-containing protein n=1 Tax=Aquipseudomonas alcaligenes TaxID=43263 RepID=UPI00364B464D
MKAFCYRAAVSAKGVEEGGASRLTLGGKASMLLRVRPDTTAEKQQEILDAFCRAELKKLVPELLEKWQPILGVTVIAWGIKRVKTKWGTCNIESRRIWLNLELAKKTGAMPGIHPCA